MASTLTSPVPFVDPAWCRQTHDNPYFKDSHRKLQREVREYVDEFIIPQAADWEKEGAVPEEAMRRHAERGYLAASTFPIPQDYIGDLRLPGGIAPQDWDGFHDLIIIDEIARCGYLGVVWGINGGATVGGPPLALFGTNEQKKRFLAPLLQGKQRHCLAITEPDAGSDVARVTTTAEKTSDGRFYVVNGAKKWITQGVRAEYCLAAVRTGAPGHKGISMLMIPLGEEGVSKRRMENTGVKASGSTFLEFDNVHVPIQNLIGEENQGFKIIMATFNHERLWMGITALRLARVCLHDAWEYAIQRETFGQPLIENQVIREKFTRMAGLLETTHAFCEELVYEGSRGKTSSPTYGTSAALLKVQAARTLEFVSRECQQIFGGLSYSRGGRAGRVEQISRDVRVIVVSGGSEEILTDMIAKQSLQLYQKRSSL